MAGKGIEINMLANDRDFQRGVKNVADGLDKVSDALDDVSRESDKATDDLVDGAKDSAKSVEKLEKSFREVADASKRETATAADAMKRNTSEGTSAAKRDLAELKDEAVQNASETFSSFDGSAQSFADGIQGTLGGIVSSMGPVGAAIGAAGALGLGIFMSKLEEAQEQQAELKAKVAELAGELIDIGGDPAESVQRVADNLKELASSSEEGESTLSDLQDAARYSKTGFDGLAEAFAGNVDGLEELIKSETKYRDELWQTAQEQANMNGGVMTADLKEQVEARKLVVEKLEEQKKIAKEAAEEEQAWIAAGGPAIEARANAIETLQDELTDAIGGWQEYTDAETNATDPGAYISAMQERMDATANFNANVQSIAEQFNLSSEETQAILDQGVDFAPMLQSIIDSGMGEQYATTIQEMLAGGQSIVDGTPIHSTIKAKGDTAQAEADLSKTGRGRDSKVTAKAATKDAGAALDQTADKKRTAKITAKAETGRASSALDRLAKDRKIKITAQLDTAQAETDMQAFLNRYRTTQVNAELIDDYGRRVNWR